MREPGREREETHVFILLFFSLSSFWKSCRLLEGTDVGSRGWNHHYVLKENGRWLKSQRGLWATWTDPAVSVPAGGQRSGNVSLRRTKTLASALAKCWDPWSGEQGCEKVCPRMQPPWKLSFPLLAPQLTFPGHRVSWPSGASEVVAASGNHHERARVFLKHCCFCLPFTKSHSRGTAH